MGSDPAKVDGEPRFGAWHPGLESQIPARLLPLATIHRPENVETDLAQANELSDLTGLPGESLVRFRPARLALHELLIRVTADFTVDDGPRSEDLGINFRNLARRLQTAALDSRAAHINATWQSARDEVSRHIDVELEILFRPARPAKTGWFRKPTRTPAPRDAIDDRVRNWEARAECAASSMETAALRALVRVVCAVHTRHGRLWGDRRLLGTIATTLALNEYGSARIGDLIDPWLRDAAVTLGLRRLPAQARPIILNTKGASASGKSSLRPRQRSLASRIGVDWRDFALVSPDIWRKYLLDYASLGADFKYAGSLTGHELRLVDQKLDRHMARKAEGRTLPHLLIDRFRFDSFAPDSDEAGSNLLTRFGDQVFLFFMITPPHDTVERAWSRGLEVGRFKAVDDLLAHNVEAYSGMPQLFFTWALRADKSVHYEFLDNSVAQGEVPRTVAFGWNGEMNVLDVAKLLDVERYRRVNVGARSPQQTYPAGAEQRAEQNLGFLRACARQLNALNFADPGTGRIYARLERGRLTWVDAEGVRTAFTDPDCRVALQAVAPGIETRASSVTASGGIRILDAAEHRYAVGRWGAR